MNQTNGTKIQNESLKKDFKEKWNKFEVVERETKRYPFRLRLALISVFLALGLVLIMAFVSPNENPLLFISVVFVMLALLGLAAWLFDKGFVTVNVVYPYDPAKTQEWREKKKFDKHMKDLKNDGS